MKARPILFSSPMVRALLDGRKTQTRRVIKFPHKKIMPALYDWRVSIEGENVIIGTCPYGKPGDLLWVRETAIPREKGTKALYKADYSNVEAAGLSGMYGGWKPSIHMPRVLSRITLEITYVRVQQLQDISDIDAYAEGCDFVDSEPYNENFAAEPYKAEFIGLWKSIHGPDAWDKNPWVWAVTFDMHHGNVDHLIQKGKFHA